MRVHVVADQEPAHAVGQRADALLRVRLLHGGDERGRLGLAHDAGEGGVPLRLGGPGAMRLPSSLTEPISIGTFLEISGAPSKKDRMVMMRPSTVGPEPTRGAALHGRPAPGSRCAAVDLGGGGVAGRVQLGPLHLLERADVLRPQAQFLHELAGKAPWIAPALGGLPPPPDCTDARWNRPAADGMPIRVVTLEPPPDWP